MCVSGQNLQASLGMRDSAMTSTAWRRGSEQCLPSTCVHAQSNERLLKLYESGLPAWAIYMPLYRLPYRPWMRKVTSMQ